MAQKHPIKQTSLILIAAKADTSESLHSKSMLNQADACRTTTYEITPIAKPRMTRADKWKQRPPVMRYRMFCDEARLHQIELPDAGAHVTFVMPMPPSWSQKKRTAMNGKPHQSKPDCDNMLKALMDALFDDDSSIWDCRITKVWGEKGLIIIGEIA